MWHIYSDMSIHVVWHSFGIFSGILSGICSDILSGIWLRSGSAHWDLELAIRSRSAHWISRGPHQVGKIPIICNINMHHNFPIAWIFPKLTGRIYVGGNQSVFPRVDRFGQRKNEFLSSPAGPFYGWGTLRGSSPEIDGDWDHRVGETDESVVYPWIQFKDI